MERPLKMVNHGVLFGGLSYLLMKMLLKQPSMVAEKRAVLLACVLTMYMVMYGHALPKL